MRSALAGSTVRKSRWSKINRDKALELIEQGRATVPADFQALLDQNPAAQAFFNQLNSINRYAILYRIGSVKKPETRQKRRLYD